MTAAAAICTEWRPIGKNSLRGAATIQFASGLILCEILVFAARGKRWAMPPSRPMVDRDGRPVKDGNGKPRYVQLIDFVDKTARSRWSEAVIAAIAGAFPDALDDGGGAPGDV
jgi:hypothetical protein